VDKDNKGRRMKKLAILLIVLLTCSNSHAGTYTTNHNLYKPAVNEKNWGTAVNANWDTIDANMGVSVESDPVYIADPAFSIDANSLDIISDAVTTESDPVFIGSSAYVIDATSLENISSPSLSLPANADALTTDSSATVYSIDGDTSAFYAVDDNGNPGFFTSFDLSDNTVFYNHSETTATFSFDASLITAGQNRIIVVPDRDITLDTVTTATVTPLDGVLIGDGGNVNIVENLSYDANGLVVESDGVIEATNGTAYIGTLILPSVLSADALSTDSSGIVYASSGGSGGSSYGTTGSIAFYASNGNVVSGSNTMYFSAATGSVGFGTYEPQARLHVVGSGTNYFTADTVFQEGLLIEGTGTTSFATSMYTNDLYVDGIVSKVLSTDSTGKVYGATVSGVGGGNPGGSDTQVQFNDSGSFGGDSGLVFNKTTNSLTVGAISASVGTIDFSMGQLTIPSISGTVEFTRGNMEMVTGTNTAVFVGTGTGTIDLTNTTYKIGTFERNGSTASGSQSVTGLGFKPSAVLFFAGVHATAHISLGMSDGTNHNDLFDTNADSAGTYWLSTQAIRIYQAANNQYWGTISTMDSDGFTIDWTKHVNGVGTIKINYFAIK